MCSIYLIRMKELAQKQQKASQKEPQTPPSSPTQVKTPTPQRGPTPLTDEPPPPLPDTPLQRTLLEMLNDKDLGATGFVTASELAAVLRDLPDNKSVRNVDYIRCLDSSMLSKVFRIDAL